MVDFRARLRPLFRRTSTASSGKSSSTSSPLSSAGAKRSKSKISLLLPRSRKSSVGEHELETAEEEKPHQSQPADAAETPRTRLQDQQSIPEPTVVPEVTVQTPTPGRSAKSSSEEAEATSSTRQVTGGNVDPNTTLTKPQGPLRRQSLAHSSQTRFLQTLLESDQSPHKGVHADDGGGPALNGAMLHRKIWVKRPGASATLVSISEDDLVDDVRDMILRKYSNSLGRSFDAPDVALRIVPRTHSHRHPQGERTLGPEEPISRTLDAYFPGGQTVDEALIIDVPQRRTPRQSPRLPVPYYATEDYRPAETSTDYFGPVTGIGQQSTHVSSNHAGSGHSQATSHPQPVHSMGVLNTGQVPPLPSPGGRNSRHLHTAHHATHHPTHRPKLGRTHTTSPTVANDSVMPHATGSLTISPLPTPPLPTDIQPLRSATPPPRTSSPRPKPVAPRRSKKPPDHPKLPAGLLDGAVPPINVLIVEDNSINLKLLEAFLKRLKVRWKTAMNGRDAVNKWRSGGFHLVLMDIQLPVMNGLDATKEIRRLERLNKIGVFSNSAANTPAFSPDSEPILESSEKPKVEDSLVNAELFKSPVIIVALTASSLQSDRHEALAAGCNDFLTKPVNFVWLERKVMEWGCMQALIDFDGWRKWKDFSSISASVQGNPSPVVGKATGTVPANHSHKSSMVGKMAGGGGSGVGTGAAGTVVNGKATALPGQAAGQSMKKDREKRVTSSVGVGSGGGGGGGSEVGDGFEKSSKPIPAGA